MNNEFRNNRSDGGRGEVALPSCSTLGDARLGKFHHDKNFGMCKAPLSQVFGSFSHRPGIPLASSQFILSSPDPSIAETRRDGGALPLDTWGSQKKKYQY